MANEILNVITIEGLDCYEKDGTAYLRLETVARGLGFTTTQNVKGTEYTNVRWNRVDEYLEEIGFATCGKRPDFIPENIFYRLAMKAKNETAEKFQAKVADEIIPAIRKTGGYVANDDLFLDTYFPEVQGESREAFKATLKKVREKNETIKRQQQEIEQKDKEITYKEDVIIGLVDNVTLAEKRQILNRVVRHNNADYKDRWRILYREFEDKYHINIKKRLESYNETHKPKCKSKLDYIDRIMGKIPELYEIAAKIFENDIKELVQEMYELTLLNKESAITDENE